MENLKNFSNICLTVIISAPWKLFAAVTVGLLPDEVGAEIKVESLNNLTPQLACLVL